LSEARLEATELATTLAVRLQCKQSDALNRSKASFFAVLPKARSPPHCTQPSVFVEKSEKGADKSGE
jgi:hypothetical protein